MAERELSEWNKCRVVEWTVCSVVMMTDTHTHREVWQWWNGENQV